MTKKEKQEKIFQQAEAIFGHGILRSLGRFLYHYEGDRRSNLFVAYRGAMERFLICKTLVLRHPEMISDTWLEVHKDKFQETPEGYVINPAHKNFPFFGLIPFRVLRRLGAEVSLYEDSGLNILYTRSKTFRELSSGDLPRGYKSLAKAA